MNPQFTFELHTSREDLDAERAAAPIGQLTFGTGEALDLTDAPPLGEVRFVEPVTTLVVATGVVFLANRIVDHWLKSREVGVQIDLRKNPPVVSKIANVPRGLLIVIDPDGNVRRELYKYESGEQLAPVLAAVFGPADTKKPKKEQGEQKKD
jgi:hypothetical protein